MRFRVAEVSASTVEASAAAKGVFQIGLMIARL
jgi:hypothetical protein